MKNALVLAGIFIFALILRLAYLHQLTLASFLEFLAVDSYLYESVANKILAGNFAVPEMACINVLYPFFLAALQWIFGHNLMAVILAQIVLDSLTCALLYLICVRIFDKKSAGILASIVYACYGMAIFYTGFLLGVSLVTFLNVLFIFILLRARKFPARAGMGMTFLAGISLGEPGESLSPNLKTSKRMKNNDHILSYAPRNTGRAVLWIFSGIVFGLSALILPFIVLFLPFLILWFFYPRQKYAAGKNVIDLFLIFAGILAVLLPFSARSCIAEKRFSPFPVSGGIHFYMGNNPEAKGIQTRIKGIVPSPAKDVKSSIREAERKTQRKLTPQQASDYWFGKGLRFIRNEPGGYLALLFRKSILFWNKREIPLNIDYYFCGKFIPMLRGPLFSFGIMAPFALLGFIFALRERPGLHLIISFIFSYMAASLLFTVYARYRFPCIPFMTILASYGFLKAVSCVRPFKAKECALCAALFVCFFVFVNINLGNESHEKEISLMNHASLGKAYLKRGMLKEAYSETLKAAAMRPRQAASFNSIGSLYSDMGILDKAEKTLRGAIKIDPDFEDSHYNLAIVYARKNMPEPAIAEYQKTIHINPENADAHHALAVLYYLKGMPHEALTAAKKSIAINNERPEPFNIIGLVYSNMGMLDKSLDVFKKAIKIEPANADSHYNLAGVCAKNGRSEDAIAEYEKTIELDPGYGDAHYRLAVLCREKKDYKKASYHCGKAIECGFEAPSEFVESLAAGAMP